MVGPRTVLNRPVFLALLAVVAVMVPAGLGIVQGDGASTAGGPRTDVSRLTGELIDPADGDGRPRDRHARSSSEGVLTRAKYRIEKLRDVDLDDLQVKVKVVQSRRNSASYGRERGRATGVQSLRYRTLGLLSNASAVAEFKRFVATGGTSATYYPANDTIVYVKDGDEQVKEWVLAQEVYHAYQYDRFDLNAPVRFDGRQAYLAVVEGDANHLEQVYRSRCADTWNCSGTVSNDTETVPKRFRPAYYLLYHPYSDGPAFIEYQRGEAGLRRSELPSLYRAPPDTTRQVIYPSKYGSKNHVQRELPDVSSDGWKPVNVHGDVYTDRIGPAGIAMMLYGPDLAEYRTRGTAAPDGKELIEPDHGQFDTFDYRIPGQLNWEGGAVRYYSEVSGNGWAFVWRIDWQTSADAARFKAMYVGVLRSYGANNTSGNVYVFPKSVSREGAIRIEQYDDETVITRAPTSGQLDEVNSGFDPDGLHSSDGGGSIFEQGVYLLASLACIAGALIARRKRTADRGSR